MTDRHGAYIVILERGIRSDDAEPIINALKQIKGVIKVEPLIENPAIHLAVTRAKYDLRQKLWQALEGEK